MWHLRFDNAVSATDTMSRSFFNSVALSRIFPSASKRMTEGVYGLTLFYHHTSSLTSSTQRYHFHEKFEILKLINNAELLVTLDFK
jgi:hypothetical protein